MNRNKIAAAGFACTFVAVTLLFIIPSGDPAAEKKSALQVERPVTEPSPAASSVEAAAMPGIMVAQQNPRGEAESVVEASDSAPLQPSVGAPLQNQAGVVDKQLLRKQFPDKIDLIPITQEEVDARKEVIMDRYERFRKILANRATEIEINAYYDEKEQLTLDRMEIVGFSINEFGDRMDEDNMFRHKTTLMILEKQLEAIPEKRAKALKRLHNATGNNGTG